MNITKATMKEAALVAELAIKMWDAHSVEELTLLKCPYGLKQSTDSVQSLSKPCEIFFTEIEKKHPKMCVE